jgi:hypothetical protein
MFCLGSCKGSDADNEPARNNLTDPQSRDLVIIFYLLSLAVLHTDLHYSISIRYQAIMSTFPQVIWVDKKKFVEFNGSKIRARDFPTKFVNELVREAQKILKDRLLRMRYLPNIPFYKIRDDKDIDNLNLEPGYSFASHERNPESVLPKMEIRLRRDLPDKLTPEQGETYLKAVDDFLELILLACVGMGGPTCGGLDIASLKIANGNDGSPRSIIIHNCQVTLIRTDTNHELIARPLNSKLGTLIVVYIIGVLPYLRTQYKLGLTHPATRSNYLFFDGQGHWPAAKYVSTPTSPSIERVICTNDPTDVNRSFDEKQRTA